MIDASTLRKLLCARRLGTRFARHDHGLWV